MPGYWVMMTATFSITADVPRDLICLTMAGFFTVDDIARFIAERDRAHMQLRCLPNRHLTLVDIRGMVIQSQESVDRFQAMLANPATRSRRIAFVVARSLARMQIKRAAASRDAAYFMTIEEATAWLLDDGLLPSDHSVLPVTPAPAARDASCPLTPSPAPHRR